MARVVPKRGENADERRLWFERVYGLHYATIFGYLRARVSDASQVDDLAQEVFLRCYAARDRFDPTRGVDAKAWLRGIARNVLWEHIRRIKRRKEVQWTELCMELDELTGDSDDGDDRLDWLPGCLTQLGESASFAIRSHYMSGMKINDISDKMGRTLGSVKVLMVRARQSLRRCIQSKLKQDQQPGGVQE